MKRVVKVSDEISRLQESINTAEALGYVFVAICHCHGGDYGYPYCLLVVSDPANLGNFVVSESGEVTITKI